MTIVTIAVPVAGTRMTLAEWERLPEATDRVELLEGVVVVTSSPSEPHQAMVTRLSCTRPRVPGRVPGTGRATGCPGPRPVQWVAA